MLTKLTSGFAYLAGPPASIDFTGAPAVTPATLLGIVDSTTGLEVYVADDPGLAGAWQGRMLVLLGASPAISASDQLFVFVNDGRTAAGDDTLAAFAATAHADAASALAVAEALATDNTLKGVAADLNNLASATHGDLFQIDADLKAAAAQAHTDAATIAADVVKLDADLKAAAAQAHTDAQAQMPFAPARGTTMRLTVGQVATTNPPKFPATAGVTSYRVRNEATSASPVTWALPSSSPPASPVIPTPYDVTGAGGAPGDKTIDPGGVEIIALTAVQIAAAATGTLMLSAICPAGGSAILAVTLGTGA